MGDTGRGVDGRKDGRGGVGGSGILVEEVVVVVEEVKKEK